MAETMEGFENPGLEVSIARCFAFVGPHLAFDKHFAIGNFIASAMRNEDIYINSDGSALRSYLYAADLAHWLWSILFSAQNGHAYNVGGAESLSIGQLAFRVNSVLGGTGKIHIKQKSQDGSQPNIYLPALHSASMELGLNQFFSLDESIKKTALWASKELKF
jgi:dTDP-glucose 4,6-dehydratase